MPRLRRSHLDGLHIARRRSGRGFSYRWSTGEKVDDPAVLERIAALAIPPAWTDVRICPWPNGHIQAIGTDAAGRRQYRYHDEWRRRRDEEKFSRMLAFGTSLPAIRATVAADLKEDGLARRRVLALGVRLLDIGMFRVGGEEYAEEHETYGVATLEKRHLVIRGSQAIFDYPAKGGKPRHIVLEDPTIVGPLSALKRRRGGGDELLAWREGRRWVDLTSHELNAYIKEISGGPFSAKDFRTWDATLLAAALCAELEPSSSPSTVSRQLAGVVREVSEALGNTPAVCRKSYIDPRVLDRFTHGESIVATVRKLRLPFDRADPKALRELEEAVLDLLSDGELPMLRAS